MDRKTRQAARDWESLSKAQQRALLEGESTTAATANVLAARGLVRCVTRYESALDLRRFTGWQEYARGRRAREYGEALLRKAITSALRAAGAEENVES